MSVLSGLLKAIDTSGALFFYSALYNKTTEFMPICSLEEGVVSHPFEKDPSDAVENRRRAALQSSTCIKIQ